MAERLESFQFVGVGRPMYPWTEWMDGSIWRIRRGVDFTCSIPSMRSSLIQRARRYGVKVRTTAEAGSDLIVFQFYTADET